jgi:hypothetical protein
MRVLKGILSESSDYYSDARKKINDELAGLPKGNIKERLINKGRYYYLQYRSADKIIHKYLGKNKPEALIKQIKRREVLKNELKKVQEALKILKRAEGKKRDKYRHKNP